MLFFSLINVYSAAAQLRVVPKHDTENETRQKWQYYERRLHWNNGKHKYKYCHSCNYEK